MKLSTIALALVLSIVLFGAMLLPALGSSASGAPKWELSPDPTRVAFQAVQCRGDSCRSATLFGDGRVELWQENPRSPKFREEVRWLGKSGIEALGTTALASRLPDWGDDESFDRLKKSDLDSALQASGDERVSVMLVLHSPEIGRDLVRFLEIPINDALSAGLVKDLPELAWASHWATQLLDPGNLAAASSKPILPGLKEASYELPGSAEAKVLELRSTSMDMTTTKLTFRANGQMTYEVSRKETVSRQLTSSQLTNLLDIAIAGGLAEWHEPTILAKAIRLNSGRPVAVPEDASTFGLVVQLNQYQRGTYLRRPLMNKVDIASLSFFRRYFPEIQEYKALEALLSYPDNSSNAGGRPE